MSQPLPKTNTLVSLYEAASRFSEQPELDLPRPAFDRFIKIRAVMDRVGLSSTSIYTFMKRGEFPPNIKVGRTSLWSEYSINAWMDEKKTEAGL